MFGERYQHHQPDHNLLLGLMCDIYRVVQKKWHNFKYESGLHSRVKLHTRQFQHVKGLHINSQLNLTKNLEMPDVLKKSV